MEKILIKKRQRRKNYSSENRGQVIQEKTERADRNLKKFGLHGFNSDAEGLETKFPFQIEKEDINWIRKANRG